MKNFTDRYDAANQLIPHLKQYTKDPDTVIIAIPRGGLELGYVLARALHLPLDVVFTKKIGYPGNPEYAIGAVGLQYEAIAPQFANEPALGDYIRQQTEEIRKTLRMRSKTYRGDNAPIKLADKIVIIVDDGAATGSTLLATIEVIKEEAPQKIIVALPVASPDAYQKIKHAANEVICLRIPELFFGVGQFYTSFNQVDDQEAIRLLHEANS